MTKTLIIGLDAATWKVIDPLLESEDLPNISDIIENGVRGPLSTTVPPMTPLAWTSMATGANPGRHGIFDFLEQTRETGEVSPVDFSSMDTPTFWDIFADQGKEIGVINYPMVHPPREIDPFFIGGIPAHEKQKISYPDEVQQFLDEIGYRVHPHVDPEVNPEQFYWEVEELTETQVNATVELTKQHNPETLCTVLMGIDWIQHHFWGEMIDGENALEKFYKFIDSMVGRLLELLDDDGHVILMSDHGAHQVKGVIHMNSLLENRGYVTKQTGAETLRSNILDKALRIAWDFGTRLPPGVKQLAKQNAPNKIQEAMKTAAGAGQSNLHKLVDWESTEAYSYGYMGRVFVNTEQKTDAGPVAQNNVEQVRESLREELLAVTDPRTGEKIFENVLSREETYSGKKITQAADLIAIPKNWDYTIFGDFSEKWIHPPKNRIADHDSEGIFICSGPEISGNLNQVDITDIAPTILYMNSLPVFEEMDGNIHTEIFTQEANERREQRSISDVQVSVREGDKTQKEKEEVEERLEDLGYL